MDKHSQAELNPGEKYEFSCTCCGDCCCGDIHISVNLYDCYKLTRYLDLASGRELVRDKWILFEKTQNALKLPELFFRVRPVRCCPFLINSIEPGGKLRGFCSLHPGTKPLVCQLAPVGREFDLKTSHSRYVLLSPTEQCPGMCSSRQNSLDTLCHSLAAELDWEARYYRILDTLLELPVSERNKEVENLFQFDPVQDFEAILQDLEIKHLSG